MATDICRCGHAESEHVERRGRKECTVCPCNGFDWDIDAEPIPSPAPSPGKAGERCEECGQGDPAPSGEYPCEKCGRPTLHDEILSPAPTQALVDAVRRRQSSPPSTWACGCVLGRDPGPAGCSAPSLHGHAPSPGKAGAFEESEENIEAVRAAILDADASWWRSAAHVKYSRDRAWSELIAKAALAWARARSRAAEPKGAYSTHEVVLDDRPLGLVIEKGAGGEGTKAPPESVPDRHTREGDCVSCDRCAFRYGAEHTDNDGVYRCPLCAAPPDLARAVEEARAALEEAARDEHRECSGWTHGAGLDASPEPCPTCHALAALDAARTRGGEERANG